ncbi:MAG: tetratricopeptide repeat protein, partial [Polyangiaceae bacterium]
TEAAELYETQLNDTARAGEAYAKILLEDPGHARAADGMVRIAELTGDYETLVAILEQIAESRSGREKTDAWLKIAEVYEDQLGDLAEAERRYQAVLEASPEHLTALKGLDRIYNRASRYRELLVNLERQAVLADTPRQKINLQERMAALHDEEFLDHARAAACLEEVLALDPTHDVALTKLARHYRAQAKWDKLEELYETHARTTTDPARKIELLMQRARVLAEHVGSPTKATEAYEAVLELQPGYTMALEAVARLREQAGDARAALGAIEELAEAAATPAARSELWVRAAVLLEGRGDLDGAIERYERAAHEDPVNSTTATALRLAYAARGDAASVVKILERELSLADGDMAKARLHGELARVLRDKLFAGGDAEKHAKSAIAIDPANADALQILGDLAFEE